MAREGGREEGRMEGEEGREGERERMRRRYNTELEINVELCERTPSERRDSISLRASYNVTPPPPITRTGLLF